MPSEPSSRRIERRLTMLFPSTALEDHAEVVGVVERDSNAHSSRNGSLPPLNQPLELAKDEWAPRLLDIVLVNVR